MDTTASQNIFIDDLAPDARAEAIDTERLFRRYLTRGPHPEYQAFEARIGTGIVSASGNLATQRRRAANVWEFIENAVDGTGGFANGAYLFPFAMEIEGGKVSDKLARRMIEADYDRFAEHIRNAPWDLVGSAADMIERKASGNAQPLLEELWRNVDGRGTSMLDFLEYVQGQARDYGTGWVFVDRPDVELKTLADDHKPENRPYLYSVPTRNVVDWEFDDDGDLIGLVVLEPEEDDDSGFVSTNVPPIRVWTRTSWAVYTPSSKDAKQPDDYTLTTSGLNTLGEVPVALFWNQQPPPGRALGKTEMLDVARLAQTVYNIDSEAREIERKAALFLAIPVKSTKDYDGGTLTLSTDAALVYDGDAGEPKWVSPDLAILERLDKRRGSKKADAYQMAGLGALTGFVGTIQTKSGFHAEVEFSKTERRVARHASMAELTEKRIAILYLKFYGIDAIADPSLFSVTYPRDFGIRDMQKLIDDAIAILGLTVGEEWERAELAKLARARFPRKAETEISAMVEGAVKARSIAQKQQSAIGRVKALADQIPRPAIQVSRATHQSDLAIADAGGEAPPQ